MVTYKFPAKHLNIQRTDLIKTPDPGALVRIWFHTNSSSQISYSQLTVKIFADTRPSGKLYHWHKVPTKYAKITFFVKSYLPFIAEFWLHPRPPLDNQVDIRVLVVIICKGPLSTKCDLHPLHSLAFVMLLLLSLAWKKAIITALTLLWPHGMIVKKKLSTKV